MPPSEARPSLATAWPTSCLGLVKTDEPYSRKACLHRRCPGRSRPCSWTWSMGGPGSRTTRSRRHVWTRSGPAFPEPILPGAAPRPRAAPRTSASRDPPSSSSTRRNVAWITSTPSIGTLRTTTGRALRASNGLTVVLALTMTVVAGTEVSAHRREDCLQAARIGLAPDGALITLDLTPGIAVAESFVAALDRDRDGSLSADEQRGYAGQVVRALAAEIDERPLPLRVLSWSFPEPEAFRRGEGTIRLKVLATLSRVSAGSHRLLFRNAHLAGHSAYLANALVPESPRVTVTAQRRDPDQSELTIEYTVHSGAGGATLAWAVGSLAAAFLMVRFRPFSLS